MKSFKVVCIVQVYNEIETLMLPDFLGRTRALVDDIVFYDDGSTDGSFEFLLSQNVQLLRSSVNNFKNEVLHKKQLIEKANDLSADYILSLDADEYLDLTKEDIQELCSEAEEKGIDGFRFDFINLWRSLNHRRVDKLFDEYKPVKLWKNKRGEDPFPQAGEGLHQTLHPSYVLNIQEKFDVKLYHLGFSTKELIFRKYLTYKSAGQKGFLLDRFIDESELALKEIDYSSVKHFQASRKSAPEPMSKEHYLIEAYEYAEKIQRPKVSIVCLVYRDIKWLDFVYSSILKYTDLKDKEFYFVANDATPEVINHLRDNYIPHYVFENSPEHKKEHYINNVYRAYNYGAQVARGDFIVLINSDMAFTPNWFENLYAAYDGNSCIASRLVEHGKLAPGTFGIAKNFGDDFSNYKEEEFLTYAKMLEDASNPDGGLYMPLFIRKDVFHRIGGYPEGNIKKNTDIFNPEIALPGEELISGDTAFMMKLKTIGVNHRTCFSSIVYHFQEGEKRSEVVGVRGAGDKKLIAVCNDIVTGTMGEKVLWDLVLELPRTIGLDYAKVGGSKDKNFIKFLEAKANDVKIVLQNASFMDLVDPSRFIISFLQDDLRKMGRASFDQEFNLKNSSLLVTNSPYVASSYPEFSFKFIPVGVDELVFSSKNRSELRSKYQIDLKAKVGIFVGALNEVKGWSQVKKCIEDNPGYQWLVVSKYKESFIHPNVIMFNQISHDKLSELISCADFFILGSKVETQCLAAIEAALCDVPIVMNRVGVFEGIADKDLDQIGVFDQDFSVAIKLIFEKSFSPRSTVLKYPISTSACKESWHALLSKCMQRIENNKRYIGENSKTAMNTGTRNVMLYRIEFLLRKKVLRRIIKRDYFYTIPEISTYIKKRSPKAVHVILRGLWRVARGSA